MSGVLATSTPKCSSARVITLNASSPGNRIDVSGQHNTRVEDAHHHRTHGSRSSWATRSRSASHAGSPGPENFHRTTGASSSSPRRPTARWRARTPCGDLFAVLHATDEIRGVLPQFTQPTASITSNAPALVLSVPLVRKTAVDPRKPPQRRTGRRTPNSARSIGLLTRIAVHHPGCPRRARLLHARPFKGLFRGWLYYSARMMPFGKLSRKDTEMIIIRVRHLRSCDYEMDHHRNQARRARQRDDRPHYRRPRHGWGDRERSLLLAVDEIVGSHDVTDETWAGLTRHLDEPEQVSFVRLVANYDALATTLGVLRVQRDGKVGLSVPSLAQHLMANPVVSAVYEACGRRSRGSSAWAGLGTAEYDKAFTAYLATPGGRRVLDVACGPGLYTRRLAQPDRRRTLHRPRLLEAMLARAVHKPHPRTTFIRGDAINCRSTTTPSTRWRASQRSTSSGSAPGHRRTGARHMSGGEIAIFYFRADHRSRRIPGVQLVGRMTGYHFLRRRRDHRAAAPTRVSPIERAVVDQGQFVLALGCIVRPG